MSRGVHLPLEAMSCNWWACSSALPPDAGEQLLLPCLRSLRWGGMYGCYQVQWAVIRVQALLPCLKAPGNTCRAFHGTA